MHFFGERKIKARNIVLLLQVSFCFLQYCDAQVDTGQVLGTVLDQQGAAVVGRPCDTYQFRRKR